ncbi:MAG: bifunctional acetate--CoA ligase family protein/GNAT family N-acetyltransferase [Devosia sp.]
MTIRNLTQCFRPQSVAVVGASPQPGSVGAILLANIRAGGFGGAVFPVNPKYDRLADLRCYPSALDLPQAPDLAIIATPPGAVPVVVEQLAERGCKAAVVVTAGLNGEQKQAALSAARPKLMRIVGPNTIGTISPLVGLNGSFAHLMPSPGQVGLISQSGAIVSSIVDWAAGQDIGFSQLISLGDMIDVDIGDCINWLAVDRDTKSILMYLESVPEPRKFMSAARAAARLKPVIAVKPGRHGEAAQAAMTHTGALSAANSVVEAALRRAGVIRVSSLEQLFAAAEVTSRFRPMSKGRVGIVTNGGGAGVMAVDDLLDLGMELASITPETTATLAATLPPNWSRANPVDIIGDAPPQRYTSALAAVAADPGVDAILAMNCPTALSSPVAAAEAVAGLARNGLINAKPVIACWMGKEMAEPARATMRAAGVVAVDTPQAAAQAVSFLTRWSRLVAQLYRVPPSSGVVSAEAEPVRAILRQAAAEGRNVLTEPEAKEVLRAYGVPVPDTRVATTEAEAGQHAAELLRSNPAVVVKLLSKTVSHKSDVGGVVLDLHSAEEARAAAATIRQRAAAAGLAQLDGFTVQPMVRRKHAQELLLGMTTDRSFGPVVVFGAGGTSVEVVRDTASGLVPLDDVLAGDLIDETRVSKLLAGYRDRPAADRSAILGALLSLSQLAVDHPAIVAVDVNPLLADESGVIALDARVEIAADRLDEPVPNRRLAVRPYPAGWERRVRCGEAEFDLRPIRPADAALYPRFLERVTREDLRLRFLVPTAALAQETIVRFSQLDYDRDIAFVALEAESGELAGICRYASDPDHERAEFGVLVRSDLHGIGLGTALMRQLLDYARADGLAVLEGTILRENAAMLDLAERLGFERVRQDDVTETLTVSLPLRPAKADA